METVEVIKELCIGCGSCCAICPKNFDFDDDGLAEVIDDKVTDEVKEAAEACPTDAIKIKKEEN